MSFNICLDAQNCCENAWAHRKGYVASIIRFHNADIVGLQEPCSHQIQDLEELLNEYDWYGIGLENGKDKGLFDPILFRKDKFEVLEKGYFFLSEDPNEPMKSWDSKFVRGVTWIKFKDLKSQNVFYFFNTHFDYHSQKARNESATLLKNKILEICKNHSYIVTGDFNIFPELGGEETYNILTSDKSLIDAQFKTIFPHHGPTGSWSGFKEAGQPGIKPDYIFVNSKIEVISHGILTDTFDGKFPSDHLPVIAELRL
ncbi:MAG: endonuclease/exonuclease/phosphatase family protein [Chlamydiae bacterium]|nr:endonuclease/exonuclease/phosphatase family protein [Chlamydiota bacterium]